MSRIPDKDARLWVVVGLLALLLLAGWEVLVALAALAVYIH